LSLCSEKGKKRGTGMRRQSYTEIKACELCGNAFAEKSIHGNCYHYCKPCRVKKYEEMKQFIIKEKQK
jgi:hypothetical protein